MNADADSEPTPPDQSAPAAAGNIPPTGSAETSSLTTSPPSAASQRDARSELSPQQKIIADYKDHWRKVGYELPAKSVERLEEGAKQLVGLNSTLQGLYFAAFAFSDLRKQAGNPVLLLFLIPLIFSIISLASATMVYVPQLRSMNTDDISLTAWERIRDGYNETVASKRRWLQLAHGLLIGSFITLAFCVGIILSKPAPEAPAAPSQIVLLTPTPSGAPTTTP